MSSSDRYTSRRHAGVRSIAQQGLMKPVIWSLASVRVFGRENMADLEAPYIVVANHSSHLDAPLIFGALPGKHSRYLASNAAADYFFDVPWRRVMTQLFFNAFPVDRTTVRRRNAGMSGKLLQAGVPLLVFPEGTRSMSGEMGPFKPGVAGLAMSQGVPCLPVAIAGAYDAMPKGASWVKKGRPPVTVNIGRPMQVEPDEDAVAFTERLAKEVRALSDEGIDRRERLEGSRRRLGRGDR